MDNGNNTLASASGTEPNPKSGKKNSLIGSLVVGILALIGVVNQTVDSGLVKYHNGFVKEAYNSILLENWNPMAEKIKGGTSNDNEIAAYLKANFIPEVQKWRKVAEETKPPSFAEEYHSRFQSDLVEMLTKAERVVSAINKGDETAIAENAKHLNDAVIQIQTNYDKFRGRLATERNFTFEEK
ncbi:MAG: hypothetical protein J5J00_02760 [Deltaproteobacteria bacterium]|nr:hypothetical protein [Deltaproteobacteria bacterium]